LSADVLEHPSAREARDVQFLALAMTALGAKAYRWVSLFLVTGAAAFALWEPSILRIITLVVYALLTHVPLWWKEMRASGER
jgi:hypothetical protein